jgi:hypothetical protein
LCRRRTRTPRSTLPGRRITEGGKSGSYDDWTKQDLIQRAGEIGIKGRSTMTRAELIKALRNH